MTISSGGYNLPNPSFSPTPTIFEQETSGANQLQNKGELTPGTVVIVPQSQSDEMPFSKLTERDIWKYQSESGRPSLPPSSLLRGNAPNVSDTDGNWQIGYSALKEDLSPELQEELANPTMEETGALNDVLQTGGKSMAWVDNVSTMVASENGQARAIANQNAPVLVNQNALSQVNEMAFSMQEILEEVGPNAPFYGESNSFVGDVTQLAQERESDE